MGKSRSSNNNGVSNPPFITSEVLKELDELVETENITYTILNDNVIVKRNGIEYNISESFLNHENFSINGNTSETLSKVFSYYDEYPPDLQTVQTIMMVDELGKAVGLYKPENPNTIFLAKKILDYNHPEGSYNSLRYVMYHESAHSLDYAKGSYVTKFGWNPGEKVVGAVTSDDSWQRAHFPPCTYYASVAMWNGASQDKENWAEAIAIQATYETTGSCKNIPKPFSSKSVEPEYYDDFEDWSKPGEAGYWTNEFYQQIAYDVDENRKWIWFKHDD